MQRGTGPVPLRTSLLKAFVDSHTETQSSHLHLLITIAPHTYTHIYDFLAMIFVVVGSVFIYREVMVA